MKLIHCADIHLDSPLGTHMTPEQAAERNAEVTLSFVRLTEYAARNGVRAVIIAGDLFDGERVRARTVDTVLDAVRATPDVDYLYLAGNHDDAARAFSDRDVPRNLRLFGRRWTTFAYGDVAVSGVELCAENAESLYEDVPHADGCLNIAVLHGQIGSSCGADRVNLNLLRNRGVDYLALGHLHSYLAQPADGRGSCAYCYPGCLEGRGFDEPGEKGFVLLTAEDGRIRQEFVPFCRRQLRRIPVDITGLSRNSEIARRMRAASEDAPRDDMVEFVLTGLSDPASDVAPSYLQSLLKDRFYLVRVRDESRMAIDPERYRHDVSLKGEFIRLVLAGDDSEEDKAALIRICVQALAGEEIAL